MVEESHTPVGDREVALEVKKHAAMARAVFLDGTEEEIPGLTYAGYLQLVKSKRHLWKERF